MTELKSPIVKYKYPWWDRPLSYGVLCLILAFVLGMTIKPQWSLHDIFYAFAVAGGMFGVFTGFFLNKFFKTSDSMITDRDPGLMEQIKSFISTKNRYTIYKILIPIFAGPVIVGVILSAIFKNASLKIIIFFSIPIGFVLYFIWFNTYRTNPSFAYIGFFALFICALLILEYRDKKS